MNALEAVNQAKDVINVRRVYGEPYQEDGLTISPAANVTGGGGGGGDTKGNRGPGFCGPGNPPGAWVSQDGQATRTPALHPNGRAGHPSRGRRRDIWGLVGVAG